MTATADTAAGDQFTRAELEQAIAVHRKARRIYSWILAFSSLALAALLVALVAMLTREMSQLSGLAAATAMFFGYLILMAVIVVATRVSADRKRVVCPLCNHPLDLLEEQYALETGQCEACGHSIVNDVEGAHRTLQGE